MNTYKLRWKQSKGMFLIIFFLFFVFNSFFFQPPNQNYTKKDIEDLNKREIEKRNKLKQQIIEGIQSQDNNFKDHQTKQQTEIYEDTNFINNIQQQQEETSESDQNIVFEQQQQLLEDEYTYETIYEFIYEEEYFNKNKEILLKNLSNIDDIDDQEINYHQIIDEIEKQQEQNHIQLLNDQKYIINQNQLNDETNNCIKESQQIITQLNNSNNIIILKESIQQNLSNEIDQINQEEQNLILIFTFHSIILTIMLIIYELIPQVKQKQNKINKYSIQNNNNTKYHTIQELNESMKSMINELEQQFILIAQCQEQFSCQLELLEQ